MIRSLGGALAAALVTVSLVGCAQMGGPMAPGAMASAAVPAKTSVVVQVSDGDPKNWQQALNVVGNLRQAYGEDKIDIELVVFGHGIGLLEFNSPQATRISDTLKSGTRVLMCENTMRGRKKTKADMLPDIGYVPGGIVEIVEKSKAGWTVVRP